MGARNGVRRLAGAVVAALGLLAGCGGESGATRLTDQFLRDHVQTTGFTAGRPTSVSITPTADAVLFLRSGPRDVIRNLYTFDTATGQTRELLTAEQILKGTTEQLTAEEKARRERRREGGRGLVAYQLSPDGESILTTLAGRMYLVNRRSGAIRTLTEAGGSPPTDPKFSPNGTHVAFVRGHDVYAINLADGKESAVTTGGTADVSHGLAEFVAQEEMSRFTGYWWSGDGQFIAFEEADSRAVETFHIADSFNPQNPPNTFRYPRPGKTNVSVRLGIAPVGGGSPVWVDWDRERYPYMATVAWGEHPLTVYVQTRDQREALLLQVDPATGRTTTLVRETDPVWINLVQGMPRWLDGETFLWQTERSGHWELELRGRDGSLRHTLRSPNGTELTGVAYVDRARREVVVNASSNPTQSHLFRIGIESGEAEQLTQQPGRHGGSFSKDGTKWFHSAALPDGSSLQVVRARDGSPIGALPSVAEKPGFVPNLELTTVDVPGGPLHSAVVRPRAFRKGHKYPVLVHVYGGPHSQMVVADGRNYLRDQWLADQGFIIVCLDGRGTPGRGREWERAIYGNVIDGPLDDQVNGLRGLATRYGEMDLSRVGIYGWSFGGYFSVMAVLKRPEVFHAGIAGAPVVDWADYDTHYTERYLGVPPATMKAQPTAPAASAAAKAKARPLTDAHFATASEPGVCPVMNRSTLVAGATASGPSGVAVLDPQLTSAPSDAVSEAYRKCSALTFASELKRPLLVIHGTADDNVYFLHSMRLAEALNKAGKPFTLLPLPGSAHGPRDPATVETVWRRHAEFFGAELK